MSHKEVPNELRTLNLIDGQWREASGGAWFDKYEPANGRAMAHIAAGTADDADAAVAAARRQFDSGEWSTMPGAERGRLMHRLADLLEANADEFVTLLAREGGRVVMEPRMMDIPMAIDTLRYFAGWADKLEGRQIPTAGFMGQPTFNYTVREAVGVAALIVPWNNPMLIGVWKLAPALAAGCTVVIKPSEDAPIGLTRLAGLAAEAGFPAGVINVVNGQAEVGQALVSHPGVNKISFTGSTPVGRAIAAVAGPQFKHLTLELGGKAPQIIFEDASLERAIGGVAMGLFANQGQTCAAGTRVLVHRSRYEEVLHALAGAARSLNVGDPLDGRTQMGALINARHADRVKGMIHAAREAGAQMFAGDEAVPAEGYFVRPTVFGHVSPDAVIAREEIFGPVGVVMPFDTVDEAVALANDTQYGLSATLWTNSVGQAHSVAARLRVGAVAINGWSPLDARLPWGGGKDSGMGRDLSRVALDAYLEEKVVSLVM